MGYYNSFVVRIWSDEQGPSRGNIEHVSSHESMVFDDPSAIVRFILLHLEPPSPFLSDGDTEVRGEGTPP